MKIFWITFGGVTEGDFRVDGSCAVTAEDYMAAITAAGEIAKLNGAVRNFVHDATELCDTNSDNIKF